MKLELIQFTIINNVVFWKNIQLTLFCFENIKISNSLLALLLFFRNKENVRTNVFLQKKRFLEHRNFATFDLSFFVLSLFCCKKKNERTRTNITLMSCVVCRTPKEYYRAEKKSPQSQFDCLSNKRFITNIKFLQFNWFAFKECSYFISQQKCS